LFSTDLDLDFDLDFDFDFDFDLGGLENSNPLLESKAIPET